MALLYSLVDSHSTDGSEFDNLTICRRAFCGCPAARQAKDPATQRPFPLGWWKI